jgi:hypothetical protein
MVMLNGYGARPVEYKRSRVCGYDNLVIELLLGIRNRLFTFI